MKNEEIINLLLLLGFDYECGVIYADLFKNGKSTPLQVSRNTEINRTKVYRRLDELVDAKYVRSETEEGSTFFSIINVSKLKVDLFKKNVEIERASDFVDSLVSNDSENRFTVSKPALSTVFYTGIGAVREQIMRLSTCEHSLRLFSKFPWSDVLTLTDYSNLVTTFNSKSIDIKELWQRPKESSETYTPRGITGASQLCFVDEEDLFIQAQIAIYNNCLSYIYKVGDEYFGVEIQNIELVSQYTQLFDKVYKSVLA